MNKPLLRVKSKPVENKVDYGISLLIAQIFPDRQNTR